MRTMVVGVELFRVLVGYAESRAEDLEEAHEERKANAGIGETARTAEALGFAIKARAAVDQGRALLFEADADARLLAALDEAQAGLEFATARGCRCNGGFICSPHKALSAVRAVLQPVSATEGR